MTATSRLSRARSLPAPVVVFVVTCAIHLVILFATNSDLRGDENRYLLYADIIRDGGFAEPDGTMANGPAYPALLAGLQIVGFGTIALKMVSVVFLAAAAALVSAMCVAHVSRGAAIAAGLFLAVNASALAFGSLIYTEAFGAMLVAAAGWLLACAPEGRPSRRRLVAVAAIVAVLVLVKAIVAYALLVTIVICGLAIAFRRGPRASLLSAVAVGALAIGFCAPFLAYTQSETGKFFYWGTTGGEHLYWMTVGGEDLWGSWIRVSDVDDHPVLVANGAAAETKAAFELPAVERDEFFYTAARDNIADDPITYGKNVAANIARTLFNMPYSLRDQSLYTYAYIVPNGLLFALLLGSLWMYPGNRDRFGFWELWIVVVALLSIAGHFPVTSAARNVYPFLAPLVFFVTVSLEALRERVVPVPHVAAAD